MPTTACVTEGNSIW